MFKSFKRYCKKHGVNPDSTIFNDVFKCSYYYHHYVQYKETGNKIFIDWRPKFEEEIPIDFILEFLDEYNKEPPSELLKKVLIEAIRCEGSVKNNIEETKLFGITYLSYLYMEPGYYVCIHEGFVKQYLIRSLDQVLIANKAMDEFGLMNETI